jgi:hypothetical protein
VLLKEQHYQPKKGFSTRALTVVVSVEIPPYHALHLISTPWWTYSRDDLSYENHGKKKKNPLTANHSHT